MSPRRAKTSRRRSKMSPGRPKIRPGRAQEARNERQEAPGGKESAPATPENSLNHHGATGNHRKGPPEHGKRERFTATPPDHGKRERFTVGPPDHGKRERFTVGPPEPQKTREIDRRTTRARKTREIYRRTTRQTQQTRRRTVAPTAVSDSAFRFLSRQVTESGLSARLELRLFPKDKIRGGAGGDRAGVGKDPSVLGPRVGRFWGSFLAFLGGVFSPWEGLNTRKTRVFALPGARTTWKMHPRTLVKYEVSAGRPAFSLDLATFSGSKM